MIPHCDTHSYQQYAHLVWIAPLSVWLDVCCLCGITAECRTLGFFLLHAAIWFSWNLIGCVTRSCRRGRLIERRWRIESWGLAFTLTFFSWMAMRLMMTGGWDKWPHGSARCYPRRHAWTAWPFRRMMLCWVVCVLVMCASMEVWAGCHHQPCLQDSCNYLECVELHDETKWMILVCLSFKKMSHRQARDYIWARSRHVAPLVCVV